ncbi:hypothetical protein [Alteromonas sp. C1M14]|nr:hypothetical protein [Alteromonas sp. C1M14]
MSIDLITHLWMGGIILFGASFYAVAFVLGQRENTKKGLPSS